MTSEIDNSKRTKHRWLYKLMLLGLLTPLMSIAGLTMAESLLPNAPGVTVVHADHSKSGQSANESPWDQALDTLGDAAAKDSDITGGGLNSTSDNNNNDSSSSSDDPGNEQADYKKITGWLSVWGFLGISNQTFWQNSNNSSASTAFDAMSQFPDKTTNYLGADKNDVDHYMRAYQQAGTYAYVMHTIGLDQSFKSGFKKVSLCGFGWCSPNSS